MQVLGQQVLENRYGLEGPLSVTDDESDSMGTLASLPDLDTLEKNAHSCSPHHCSLLYDCSSCLWQYKLENTHRKEEADDGADGERVKPELQLGVPQQDSTTARDLQVMLN